MAKKASKATNPSGKTLSREGLEAYANWEIELAVTKLASAIEAEPDVADHHLNLARVLARGGDFDQAMGTLAEFLRLEPESAISDRFMQLFGSGMDNVESVLTDKMSQAGMPIELTGAAIQMWLEFRVTLGRKPLVVRKPESWAAALDYALRKVNLSPVTLAELAEAYAISERTLQDKFNSLVNELDIMPCDYRYFVGDENPLDKLVEAAELLDGLEARFREP
jgi:tetratricopeptide (TPR) repeat protein